MAHESVIDHIDYDGVSYEFQDAQARRDIATLSRKVEQEGYAALVDAERVRALAAEASIRSFAETKIGRDDVEWQSIQETLEECQELIANPSVMTGATSSLNGAVGVVPKPMIADRTKFLRGDGTWADTPDTTYEVATDYRNGLMSMADKEKLDSLELTNDETVAGTITFSTNLRGENVIEEVLANGKTKTTTFLSDGSISQTIVSDSGTIQLNTVFNADGSITRSRE